MRLYLCSLLFVYSWDGPLCSASAWGSVGGDGALYISVVCLREVHVLVVLDVTLRALGTRQNNNPGELVVYILLVLTGSAISHSPMVRPDLVVMSRSRSTRPPQWKPY